MIRWQDLDPGRFERGVQGLLHAQNPGLTAIDGSGGDGGADAMLRTADGRTVFEAKSFSPRLTKDRRRQVASSLKAAVKTVPDMTRWVLIAPINPTRGELDWFEQELPILAPGVDLVWYDIGWLDFQAGEHPAFARMVQGTHAQALDAAGQMLVEQAKMANGVEDLFVRNRLLKERADDISLFWTVNWAVEGAVTTTKLVPKYPHSSEVDPIRLTPRFTFDANDPNALKAQAKLDAIMDYGGSVELSDQYFQGFEICASEEAKLLMRGIDEPGSLEIRTRLVSLDQPVRSTIRIDGDVTTELEIWFRTATRGQKGMRLHGSDPACAVRVDLAIPRPDDPRPDAGGAFNITFENPWNFAPRDLIPGLRLHTAMRAGGEMSIKVPGFVVAMTAVPGQLEGPDYAHVLRIAEVVTKLEQHLDLTLRMPNGTTPHQLKVAEAAVAALEGFQVDSNFSGITAHIIPGNVEQFVSQIPDRIFQVHTAHREFTVTLGDLKVPYGPIALWLPKVKLANRRALQRKPDQKRPVAKFKTAGEPIYVRTREATLAFLEGQDERSAELLDATAS